MPSPLLFFAALHRYHNCCSRPGCCGALAIGVLHRALLVVAIHPHRDASNVKRGFGALPKPSLLKRGEGRGEERGELKEMSQGTERNDKETPWVRKRCRKEKRNLLVWESSLLGFFPETKTWTWTQFWGSFSYKGSPFTLSSKTKKETPISSGPISWETIDFRSEEFTLRSRSKVWINEVGLMWCHSAAKSWWVHVSRIYLSCFEKLT